MADSRRLRSVALNVVKYLFGAAVLVFGIYYIASRWGEVSRAFERMNPALTVIAFLLVIAALSCSLLAWWVLWPAFHARLHLRHAARVFFVSQLGKYLPGSVWPIAAQAQMAAEVGVSRAASVVLSLVGMLVSVAVGLGFGAILVPFIDAGLLSQYWWLAALGVLFIVCLLPPVLTVGVKLVLRVLRRAGSPFSYTGGVAVRAACTQWGAWIAGGLHLWVLVVALGGSPWATLVPCLAAFPLAFCIGILLIPVPAGLGVREAVITLMLSAVTASSVALTAAVVSRVLYALGDFAMAGIALAIDRRRADRVQRDNASRVSSAA